MPKKGKQQMDAQEAALPAPEKKNIKSFVSPSRYSKGQVAFFCLIFGLIGGFLLYKTFAAAPVVAKLEAETMTLPQWAYPKYDSSASGGKYALIQSASSAKGLSYLPTNAVSLTVLAKGSTCNSGWPIMTVYVDDKTVINPVTVSNTYWKAFTAPVTVGAGSHTVKVKFSNDYYLPGTCDRNLYVDKVEFLGPEVLPSSKPTITINAAPASLTSGSSSTLSWSTTNAKSCTASG